MTSRMAAPSARRQANTKLLDKVTTSEKMYKIDEHIACAVAGVARAQQAAESRQDPSNTGPHWHALAGLTADANILITKARRSAQGHRYRFQEPIAVEQLIRQLCDTKQVYTQWGGQSVRTSGAGPPPPRGCALLHAREAGARVPGPARPGCTFVLTDALGLGRPPSVRRVLPVRRLGRSPWLPALPQRPFWQLRWMEGNSNRQQ